MDFVFTANGNPQPHTTKKPPDIIAPPSAKPSFRDKLMGSNQEIPTREKEDMLEKKLVRIELENGNRLLPKIHLDPQVFQELCTPWKDALVVKLLGKKLGYHTMKERLQKVWKLQGGLEIMDNDNGFYMVKLDLAADKERIITGGPWLIQDHCLAVSHWSPEFASPNAKIERTVVWIRFPGLNLVYYDESFLMAMASAIGRPIKVDINTLKVERGRFARVCVEVDLTVPVVGKIWVNGHWYKVQYEGLHLICTACGCYGHLGRNCQAVPVVQEQVNSSSSHPNGNPNSGQHPRPASAGQEKQNAPVITETVTHSVPIMSNNNDNNEMHGDWLLVHRRKKKSSNKPTPPAPKTSNNNNRFMALSTQTNKDKNAPSNQNFPPRPKPHEIVRNNNGHVDPKRRRPNDGFEEPILQNFEPTPASSSKKPGLHTNLTPAVTPPDSTPNPNPPIETTKDQNKLPDMHIAQPDPSQANILIAEATDTAPSKIVNSSSKCTSVDTSHDETLDIHDEVITETSVPADDAMIT
ncbi:hypothetical protein L195_g011081 [Trifolium pratense]|uniref:DUF4283 domain-containing protein n=1 Tax=Trifolium pratense TaxID=57577 RepID=A0A2K3PGH8_TRIPR|nr:hypothetical protein L195_g011081 [Trifolium pratense]